MSPYIVKTGVYSAGTHYGPGDQLPDGIGDEAMVEAGALEWADEDAAPAPSEPSDALDLDVMDFAALRKAAKAAGLNAFGKSADALRDELREVT